MGTSISISKHSRFLLQGLLFFLVLLAAGKTAHAIDIAVTQINEGNSLDFGQLNSLDADGGEITDIATRRVRITISNNVDNLPFRIYQVLNGEAANQDGVSLTPSAIRFRVEQETGSGVVRSTDSAPLDVAMEEIYQSDDIGTVATLLITYDLTVPPGQSAGRYYSSLTYRVDVG